MKRSQAAPRSKPEVAPSILESGLSERFSGGSSGAAYGEGVFLSDDAGKIDQYAAEDRSYSASNPMHRNLYNDTDRHPGNVFYAISVVCRIVLGHTVMWQHKECRFNEYVVFHTEQTYAEYLLAYQRV